ncbi:unnamed protein product [Polarella glacialis]|uniref:Uncharacterized protein n=1 Tax=Polarella glacialis TaxID=89957 RepID=A0A813GN90_POLGL|nr:unnamed protein product [Polarella glacialis]
MLLFVSVACSGAVKLSSRDVVKPERVDPRSRAQAHLLSGPAPRDQDLERPEAQLHIPSRGAELCSVKHHTDELAKACPRPWTASVNATLPKKLHRLAENGSPRGLGPRLRPPTPTSSVR